VRSAEEKERPSISPRKRWMLYGCLAAGGAFLTIGLLVGASRETLLLRASVLALGLALAALLAVLIWNVIAIRSHLGGLVEAGRSIEVAIRDLQKTPATKGNAADQTIDRNAGGGQRVQEQERVEFIPPVRTDKEPEVENITETVVSISDEPRKSVLPFAQSVRDFLSNVRDANIPTMSVEPKNLRPGILEANANGRLILINPNEDRRCEVVPAFDRVLIGEEIRNYDEFFECSNPRSGQVWIAEPALVEAREISGEWSLRKKGRLEVR